MTSIKYRPAKVEDIAFLFHLKNDSTVRANSIVSKDKIKWKGHVEWFYEKLKDPKTKIWIIYSKDGKIGDVRIEDSEISIKLLKNYRGQGIGNKAIRKFSKKGQVARIVEGNVASMRVFVRNGFNFLTYHNGYYTLEK